MQHMSDLYDEKYYNGGSNYESYGDDPGWQRTLVVMTRYLPQGAKVLELGCATGWFVKWANAARFDCQGIDVSQWAHENAVAETTLGDASDLSHWLDDEFDAVVSWEFLEHLPEALAAKCLAEMSRTVKDGGLLLHRIGLDLEGDAAWSKYGTGDHDPTHVLMRPRWWWEREFSVFSTPDREIEEALNRQFHERDWWGRFFARRVQKSSGMNVPLGGLSLPL
jgi:cyclopropane fatty-acyl-phospholipid synthase-like methyltransferase